MSWLQLKLETTAEYAEDITVFLNLMGAAAVTFADSADQALLEPELNTTPLWDEVTILSLFKPEINSDKIINFLKMNFANDAICHYDTEILPENNWERAWLKDFHPMQFGKNLWICPSLLTPPDPNAVNIILDPGLAFGTGTHPTTALCLEWLDVNPPHDKNVIDYGCGSGILAIAALKLGANNVWAVDHDEQALTATQVNAERNNIDINNLHTLLPTEFKPFEADLLIANILTNPLIELSSLFAQCVKPNGKLVLSGILASQIDTLKDAYSRYFSINHIVQKDDWIRIEGTKHPF